jgi:hypothetical protein
MLQAMARRQKEAKGESEKEREIATSQAHDSLKYANFIAP